MLNLLKGLVLRAVEILLGVLVFVVMNESTSPAGFGKLVVAISLISFFSIIPSSLSERVLYKTQNENPSSLNAATASILAWAIIYCGVVVFVGLFVMLSVASDITFFAAGCVAFLFSTIANIIVVYRRAHLSFLRTVTTSTFLRSIVAFVSCTAVYYFGGGIEYIILAFFSYSFIFPLFTFRVVKVDLKNFASMGITLSNARNVYIAATKIFVELTGQMDVWAISLFSAVQDVGAWGFGKRIGQQSQALQNIGDMFIGRSYVNSDSVLSPHFKKSFRTVQLASLTFVGIFNSLLVFVVLFWENFASVLFGSPESSSEYHWFFVLALGISLARFPAIVFGNLGRLLAMSGEGRFTFFVQIGSSLVLVLCFAFFYGFMDVYIAMLAAILTSSFVRVSANTYKMMEVFGIDDYLPALWVGVSTVVWIAHVWVFFRLID